MGTELNFLSALTGCFAFPAAENPTVAMVTAAYDDMGLDWRYINCEVAPEQLGDAVRGARAMGWRGFNCSIPHKQRVIDHIDGLGQSAKIIGAVNCVVLRDGAYIGENTDGMGFVESVRPVTKIGGKRLLLLGAGGAARAIAVEMALAGAGHVTVLNRGAAPGIALAELVATRTGTSADFIPWQGSHKVAEGYDILVNATSIGLFPDTSMPDLDMGALGPDMLVADVIPNPPVTGFLKAAKARGCRTLDGHGMLVNQAVTGIEYWTGRRANGAVMQARLSEIFSD